MKLEGTVFVDRPVPEVFAHLLDLERSPDWALSFGVVERRKITDGPTTVGTRFHAVDRLFGVRNEYAVTITACEPTRYVAAQWSEPIGGGWEARFDATNGGTELHFTGEMNPAGILRVLSPLMALWGRRATRMDLDRFRDWVEGVNT